jgi:hypothetical protein
MILTASSFWAAVLIGIVTGLSQVGVLDETTRDWFVTVGVPYILFRLTGDAAKAAGEKMK